MTKKSKKANQKKSKKPIQPAETTPPSLPRWRQWVLPVSTIVTVTLVILLAYFSFTNASLAPVYAGSIALKNSANQQENERQIADSAKSYRVTIEYPDSKRQIYPLANAGISIDVDRSSLNIKNHLKNSVIDRLKWWQPITINLALKTDNVKLASFIADKATIVNEVPQDAVIATPDGTVQVTPEKPGKGFGLKNGSQVIKNAAETLNPHPIALKNMTIPAALTETNLEKSKRKVQSILEQKVVFGMGGTPVTPSRADIANWIELTPVLTAKTVDVTVNAGKVVAYIDEIAADYVTLPRSKLIMTTAGGPLVLDNGARGMDIANKDEIAAQVAQQLVNNKGIQVELTVTQAEAKTVELQPYDKFIVVDTTAKRLYAYEKSNLVRTVPVSAGAPNTPTVLGQYKIYSKRASQDMKGANVDGSRYFQAAVPYVNYFYGSYAIHGNYWRPDSWFGNINSSHGCVGINDPDDAWVYNWAPIGTPVIVHD